MINALFDIISNNMLLIFILLPAFVGLIMLFIRKRFAIQLAVLLLSSIINLIAAYTLFASESFSYVIPFASFGLDIVLVSNELSSLFIMLVAAMFLFVCLYSAFYLKHKKQFSVFMLYMYISLAMLNGAILSDSLGIMLFFWEGLLCTLLGMLLINNTSKPKAAIKALVLSGTADLLLMLGIILTAYQAKTMLINEITPIKIQGFVPTLGFFCMLFGAIGKAGSMPFHSWIPEAANDATTPFLVSFPGALEKLAGFYLAVVVTTKLYDLRPHSTISNIVMTIGVLSLLFAVSMALIQKDMKRLLSYHAISQVGYMVLGIGSGLPIGIAGAVFHMLNNAVFKSCLYMCAGSIESQTSTTDLKKFSGVGKCMPITSICFTICGLAIAGVPPFCGFFSKELLFDAALESNIVFYIGALIGAFMTAVSFLKMGRAAFFGKLKLPEEKKISESEAGMLVPMIALSIICIIFGVFNTLPLDTLINKGLMFEKSFSGWPHSILLVVISLVVLCIAVLDHLYGSKKSGNALNAADHIHYAPVLKTIYSIAERGYFDLYNQMNALFNVFAKICVMFERAVSFTYDTIAVNAALLPGKVMRRYHNGSLGRYLFAALCGVVIIILIFIAVLV